MKTLRYPKPFTCHPARYGLRTNALASAEFLNVIFAAFHSSVVCGNRVATGPNNTASVSGPE
ncbi:hypothetical protein SBA6_710015 [Candidatus Sulfopaludibacter sp. SbA6]|nr:hypothetical protein SBA6_710015 [Candidatus Sulfopaludibacter sp. SbA6]